jgi:DNA polymerase V
LEVFAMPTLVNAIYKPLFSTKQKRPLFLVPVSAGFPSPADDYLEGRLDLNKHLIQRPAATFFVRASGDSMIGGGIHDGDLLIVDRSLEPKDGNVVIAVLDGELTVKRIEIHDGKLFLVPENENYPLIPVTEEQSFEVWGVVRHAIHSL